VMVLLYCKMSDFNFNELQCRNNGERPTRLIQRNGNKERILNCSGGRNARSRSHHKTLGHGSLHASSVMFRAENNLCVSFPGLRRS
jgi:hypothetical protein